MNTLWLLMLLYSYNDTIQVQELRYFPTKYACTLGRAAALANMQSRPGFRGLFCVPAGKEEA